MIIRRELFRNAEAFSNASTFNEKLPDTGMLSAILVEVNGTLVSNSEKVTKEWRLDDYLTNVKVMGNGGQTIHSGRWSSFRYKNFLDQGKLPPAWWRNYATQATRSTILIPFGRRLYDPDYGLDLSKWDRVELQITNTASATYYAGGLTVTAWLIFLHNLVSPFSRGYVRHEVYKEWTTVQDAWVYTQLPTGYPIRAVSLQMLPDDNSAFADVTGLTNLAYDVQFSIANPKLFLHNGGLFQLMEENSLMLPGLEETHGMADRTADYGFDTGLGYVNGMAGIAGTKSGAVASVVPTITADVNGRTQNPESDGASVLMHWMARGLAVENYVNLLYARDADPADCLTPSRDGSVELDVHTRNDSNAAGGTVRIALDSIYPHPASRVVA
jgi:hypothetical protein